MQAFCDKIYNWCVEIGTWAPGDTPDNLPTPTRPEHAYFATVNVPAEFYTGEIRERIPINAVASAPSPSAGREITNKESLTFEDYVLSGMYIMDAKDTMSE